ncbi:peptidoglycan-binding domain-containing protein [Arenibaculum pallidiluteum]|uniref:peptidoglycan-binding domain-containing protein n=1 Tax=Arenibaculum pallidiluteum TaxID=2812559 RepID=UPI001A95FF91|nr:peptidoglycan-binding domain-containing protein [Arenibaculum pallidiluteum]
MSEPRDMQDGYWREEVHAPAELKPADAGTPATAARRAYRPWHPDTVIVAGASGIALLLAFIAALSAPAPDRAPPLPVRAAPAAVSALPSSPTATPVPASTAKPPPATAADSVAVPGPLDREGIREIQRRLRERGFDAGTPDGFAGPRTRAAIEAFERASGLPVTGEPSAALLRRLGSVPEAAPVRNGR